MRGRKIREAVLDSREIKRHERKRGTLDGILFCLRGHCWNNWKDQEKVGRLSDGTISVYITEF